MKLTFIVAGINRFPRCNDCGKVFDLDNSQDDCHEFSHGLHYGLGCEDKLLMCNHPKTVCPNHKGSFDCNSFCAICEGFQEFCKTCEDTPEQERKFYCDRSSCRE